MPVSIKLATQDFRKQNMETTQQEIIAGLDMGYSTIRVAVGKTGNNGTEIIGVGQSPSQGMRKGQVVAPNNTAVAIREAINQAEHMAGCKVKNVIVGIADRSILSQYSSTEVCIKQRKVSDQDVRKVIESARANQLPPDRKILHIIPYEFIIDKQTKTSQPIGMTGSTLEVRVNIITVASANIENIVNACTLSGIKKINIVLQSLATAEIALLPDEYENGVLLIDFGGGYAKTAIFSHNVLCFYHCSLVSGSQLTVDLAVGMRIPIVQAEQLKQLHGCSLGSNVKNDDLIEIYSVKDEGKKLIKRQHITEIVGCRIEEMYSLLSRELLKTGFDERFVSAVITGRNSFLPGMQELTGKVLKMPVRLALARTIEGIKDNVSLPEHSTAVGLVLLKARRNLVCHGILEKAGNVLLLRAKLAIRRIWKKLV